VSQNTKIEWTHHSWSPWWGCTKVSPGCANCYADNIASRFRALRYLRGVPRQVASEQQWELPRKIDRQAAKEGNRVRIFPSMCDPFDDEVPAAWRLRFFHLIAETPNLDWLLLTKRPENIVRFHGDAETERSWPENNPPNVWLGVSVEDQERANLRLPHLLSHQATVRFVSVEPLLAPVSLERWLQYDPFDDRYKMTLGFDEWKGLDWVIIGGESGPGARSCHVEWIRALLAECRESEAKVFVKQLGRQPRIDTAKEGLFGKSATLHLKDTKGGNPAEWPDDLRRREFPHVA
jgi:protein gp37